MDKGDELTVTTDEVSRSAYIQSKATKYVMQLKVELETTLNAEATCLFSVWLASFRWHELYPGSVMEFGNLPSNAKENVQREQPGGKIPMCWSRGGLTRSSDEIPVMGVERRGQLISTTFCQLGRG